MKTIIHENHPSHAKTSNWGPLPRALLHLVLGIAALFEMPRSARAQFLGRIGEYNATTGTAINANFITGLNRPLEDGRAAYQRGDYGVAMRLLRSPRANDVAEAQRDMGLRYAQGQGVKQDFAQALIWFRKAANQGDDLAQFFLGVMYRDGNGVPQDNAKALAWYRKSADQGNGLAQFDLGSMYKHGEGIPKDAAQAAAWYRKAADQGSASAQSNLGVMSSEGDGVPKDDAQALIWFQKAADQGEAVALFNLGLAYDKGAGVAQDSAQAAVWYRKAADKGNVAAQINLGSLYRTGEGVPKDFILAYMWADLAASRAQDDETREVANKNRDNLVQGMSPEQIARARRMAREWKPAN